MKLDKWLQSSALAFMLAVNPANVEGQQPASRESSRFIGMIDQNGQNVTKHTFANKNQVVYFGLAGCGVSCPTTLLRMREAFDKLEKSDYRQKLGNTVPVFVSIQASDKPENMKAYLSAMPSPKNTIGLTSFMNPTALEAAQQAFVVVVPKDNIAAHSNAIYFVDVNNKISWLKSETATDLANSIAQKLNEQPTTKPEPTR